jgi:hypothetical protein
LSCQHRHVYTLTQPVLFPLPRRWRCVHHPDLPCRTRACKRQSLAGGAAPPPPRRPSQGRPARARQQHRELLTEHSPKHASYPTPGLSKSSSALRQSTRTAKNKPQSAKMAAGRCRPTLAPLHLQDQRHLETAHAHAVSPRGAPGEECEGTLAIALGILEQAGNLSGLGNGNGVAKGRSG